MSEQVLQGGYAPVNYVRKKKPLFGRLHSSREPAPVTLEQKPFVAPVASATEISDEDLHAIGLGELSLDKDVVAVKSQEKTLMSDFKTTPAKQVVKDVVAVEAPANEDITEAIQQPVAVKEKKSFFDVMKAPKETPLQTPVPEAKKQIALEYEETPTPAKVDVFSDELDTQEIQEAIDTEEVAEEAPVQEEPVEAVIEPKEEVAATPTLQSTNDKLAEFYSLNATEFATLPTSEFILKFKEHDSLIEAVKTAEASLEAAKTLASAARDTVNIGKYGADFQQSDRQYAKTVHAIYELASAGEFENKEGSLRAIHESDEPREAAKKFLYGSLLSKLEVRDRRINAIAHDSSVIDRFVEVAKIIEESRLDRTPRQNIETLTTFFDSIVGDVAAEVPAAQQTLDEFRTKYKLHN